MRGSVLNDIYFYDDRNGYIAADSGKLYKCALTANASVSGTAINWIAKKTDYQLGVTDSTHLDITP